MSKNFNLTGIAYWAKLVEPQENYREDGNEWSIDVTPDQKGIDLLRRVGLGEKLRNKDDDREDFITFRRNELKKDGTANNPVEVVDADGNPWPDNVLIGNGSKVKIKFSVFDMPAKGKFKAIIKPVIYKVTVLELKEYVAKKPAAPAAEAPAAKPATAKKPAAKNKDWQGEED